MFVHIRITWVRMPKILCKEFASTVALIALLLDT